MTGPDRPERGGGNGGARRPAAAGYDEWVAALADGEGFYLACPNGHGLLPPRRVCPDCGSREFSAEPLPATGRIETFSEVHVATPAFADETPYVTAVADFGPVRLTGVVRGADGGEVTVGTAVRAGAEEVGGGPTVVFRSA